MLLKCILFVSLFCTVHLSTALADISVQYKKPCDPPCCREIRGAEGTAATGREYYCRLKEVKCYAWCQMICPDNLINDGTTNGTKCYEERIYDQRCAFGEAVPPEDPEVCNNSERTSCLDVVRDAGIAVCNSGMCYSMMSGQNAYCYLQENIF